MGRELMIARRKICDKKENSTLHAGGCPKTRICIFFSVSQKMEILKIGKPKNDKNTNSYGRKPTTTLLLD
jgi:hypothetical protein